MVEIDYLPSTKQAQEAEEKAVLEPTSVITSEAQDNAAATEHWITLNFTWSGKAFSLDVAESDRCDANHTP